MPKPPYISPLKIIGLLHFLKLLCPPEENYNLQSLWINLYSPDKCVVFALFEIFVFVRKKLQSTVFNDHPVSSCHGVGGVGLGDGSAYHGRIKHPDSEDE